MTKRNKSKFQVCKRIHGIYKNLWGVQKASKFRSIKIFRQNSFLIKQKKNRLTFFGRYLNTKQIIKNFYCNISEQSFQHYVNKSIISKSPCVSKLFSLLESRIDTILYRSCLVNSLYMSRQLINHKLVSLNKKSIRRSGMLVKKGNTIYLNGNKKYFHSKLIKILKQRRLKQYYLLSVKTTKKLNANYTQSKLALLNLNSRFFTLDIQKIILKKLNVFLKLKKFKLVEIIPKHLEVNFQLFKIVFLWDPKYDTLYFPINVESNKFSKNKTSNLNNLLYKY